MRRPRGMFDREWEWEALSQFARDPRPGATLGIVYGRRRQGKSFLLEALCRQAGGFYYQATEATGADALRRLGADLARHAGAPGRLAFGDWAEAVDGLLGLGSARKPVPVVLDEFPYLVRAAPELPSLIQRAIGSPRARSARARLLLCGSAVSFMGRLLAGDAPLRGRAGLELILQTFDFRQAAQFWGLATEPRLAVRVHAIVGGTPAYRREFVGDDVPRGPEDFDDWVVRAVMNPARPLFREGRYLLAEEPDIREVALYHSVLAAIAEGNTTRGAIASVLGRPSTDIGHPLSVLEDTGFIARRQDSFRSGRPTYAVVEPVVRFYHAVMRPIWGRLERPGAAAALWAAARERFESAVLGPHFEEICRQWVGRFAGPGVLGGEVAEVGAGVVGDPAQHSSLQVDVVAFGESRRARRPILLLGEVKWGRAGLPELARLRRARSLLAGRKDLDLSACRLACFAAGGFAPDLRARERARDVLLVDPERLYRGAPARS